MAMDSAGFWMKPEEGRGLGWTGRDGVCAGAAWPQELGCVVDVVDAG